MSGHLSEGGVVKCVGVAWVCSHFGASRSNASISCSHSTNIDLALWSSGSTEGCGQYSVSSSHKLTSDSHKVNDFGREVQSNVLIALYNSDCLMLSRLLHGQAPRVDY